MSQAGAISSNGGGSVADEFVADVGMATPSGGEIDLLGGNLMNTSAAGNIVTFNVDDEVASTFTTDSGTATPVANNINILGGTGVDTSAVGDTITITFDGSEDPTIPTSFPTDAGTAVPALNALSVLGGTGLSTTGVGAVVTINAEATVPLSFPTDSGTATPALNALTIAGGTGLSTSGAGSTVTVNLDTPVVVANGGTGATSLTAYAVICGGTTSTNPLQPIASVGTSGQVLTSNGAAALPTFQAASSGSYVLLQSQSAAGSATITLTTNINSTYNSFDIIISNLAPANDGVQLYMRTSTDGGGSYDSGASDYQWVSRSVDLDGAVATENTGDAADAQINIYGTDTNQLLGNATNETCCLRLTIYNPSAAAYCFMTWEGILSQTDTVRSQTIGSGIRLTAADVNAVQFLMSAGNIATGVFKLYGRVA